MITLFGSIAVTVMMVSYWLEPRSKWFVLSFCCGLRRYLYIQRCAGCLSDHRY